MDIEDTHTRSEIVNMEIVESILKDGKEHTYIEIGDALQEQLRKEKRVSQRTVQTILQNLREVYHGNNDITSCIGYQRIGDDSRKQRNTIYRLLNTEYLVFPEKIFTQKDRELLLKILNVITAFDGMLPIDQLLQDLKISNVSIHNALKGGIEIEPNPYLEKWITPLFEAITYHHVLKIGYQQLHQGVLVQKEVKDLKVSPYYLKRFENRWYLIVKIHGLPFEWSVLALDRITSIEHIKGQYIDINPQRIRDYYDKIIGYYVPVDNKKPPVNYKASKLKTIHVVLEAMNQDTYYYIKTRPIHKSQTCDDLRMLITLDVVENPLLMKKLLSYGRNIKVHEPKSLVEKIIDENNKSLNLYKTK